MARPKASPEQRAQVRRSIQQAAAELYRAEGIAAISARAVATKAGVSVGTIYSYFGDLTGLMQSLWTDRIAELEDVFRARAAAHDDPLAQIEALLQAYLEFGIEQAILYKGALMFVRPAAQEPPQQQPLSGFALPVLLREAIVAGQGSGTVIADDPDALTQFLWSGVHGCLALPVNLDRLELRPAKAMADRMVDGLMRAIQSAA